MEPGALCPGHHRKWAEWKDMLFILIPGSKAVIDEYKKGLRIKIVNEEKTLGREEEAIQEASAKTMEQIKADAIVEAIESNDYNVTRAARELQISKATMYRAIEKYDIVLKRSTRITIGGKQKPREDPY